MSSRLDAALRHPATPLLLWAGCVTAVAAWVGHSWIPLDDGTLAQSAERVLHGQLPHRDFGDPYSGLGAVLDAGAFRLFGVSLRSLRIPLVVAFALWLPALWSLARRFASPAPALLATALAAALSVLTYPAAMPSWYGLFCTTWTLWLLLGFLDSGRRRWLVGAGVAAGVSILFKVTGLYSVAATLLTLAWHRADGSRAHRALVAAGSVLFLAGLGRMVLPSTGWAGAYHFFLPSLALCASLLRRAWSVGGAGGELASGNPSAGADRARGGAAAFLTDAGALMAGVVLPVVLFLVPYALHGGVGAWFDGVFVLPFRRLTGAFSRPGGVLTTLPGIVAVTLVALETRLDADLRRRSAMALATLLALGLAVDTASGGAIFAALWYSARGWIPALVVWGAWRVREGRRWAVIAAAALWALVQFPYAAPEYFFYVAGLGIVATLAVAVHEAPRPTGPVAPQRRRGPTLGVGPVLGLFAGLYAFLGAGYAYGVVTSSRTPLALDRGGIRVSEEDARTYQALVETVRDHAGEGGLWAGPDAPEVYFLTGIPNRTPTLYEFLAPPRGEPGSAPSSEAAMTRASVVVVNTAPLFSQPLDAATLAGLRERFPHARSVGPFVIRWGGT